eukprot:gene9976-11812_t
MGCFGSKEKSRADRYKIDEDGASGGDGGGFGNTGALGNTAMGSGGVVTKKTYDFDTNRPDPKDFTFANLKGETKIREPGTIAGQQFIIDNCEDCHLYLFDYNATVTIDDCKNCTIFIGPCETSIFIRDCTNCKCIFMCRQFRTRGCSDCDTMLYCCTRPVIETSKKMRFGCMDFHYNGMEEQMAAAQLSKFTNYWSYIHDFTPDPNNWSFLPPSTTAADLMSPAPSATCLVPGGAPDPPPFLLRTWGERPPPSSETMFVLLHPGSEALAASICKEVTGEGVTLVHANTVKLDPDVVNQIMQYAGVQKNKKFVSGFSKGKASSTRVYAIRGHGYMVIHKQLNDSTQAAGIYKYMGIEG